MTRIIAGFAGSLRLAVPPAGTRPTSDRVREAIFSALDARGVLPGARVLDLYAGSGALGLEAASRGAAHVTLVDKASAAHRVTNDNAARIRAAAPRSSALDIVVSSQPVQSFLGSGSGAGATWDVVFLDPPYDLSTLELVHNLETLVPLLAPDALVVVERSARDAEPEWPIGLELERRKNYGETAVFYLSPVERAST
ncbi:MAG TPA: 16S rRNA (guanine(966)-N(2))-methyltransferase RsmD [Pseudolysinimonas sp.]|nr:16S rRNA (guanine(966)-N(2))-methyltransferase RsmD [Pseudolysinimonas sp.]